MTKPAHLWAVGFSDMSRAEEVRREVARLTDRHALVLLDTAVVVHYPDGCVTLEGETFVTPIHLPRHGVASFFAGLTLGAPPLTGAAVGNLVTEPGSSPAGTGITDDFIRTAAALMKPGTSALFVFDREGDMDAILQGIRGLGGTVLKANVDLERVRLIQSSLAAANAPKEDQQ
jgi:uncharacterized membrane protein